MARCFLAVHIPDEIKETIDYVAKTISQKEVRRVEKKNYHITLKFLGEIDMRKADQIIQKLQDIEFQEFEVKLQGIGVFPNENYVKVIWIGVKSKELEDLSNKIDKLIPGFQDKGFVGHMTIARVTGKIYARDFIQKYKKYRFGYVKVRSFELMKSELGKGSPTYTLLASFKAEETV